MTDFQKEAQKRSVFNKTKEVLNPKEYFRRMRSERYSRISDKLKEIDEQMREKAEDQDPQLKETIHAARMAFKNREYPLVMYYAWQLNTIMDDIFSGIDELKKFRDAEIREFYESGTQLEKSEIESMHEALSKKPEKSASLAHLKNVKAAPDPELITEAGLKEWFELNFPNRRQMEGAVMERIFKNKMGKQRESAKKALDMANKIYKSIKRTFKELDSARTDINRYIYLAKKWDKFFDEQKAELSKLYRKHFPNIHEMEPEDDGEKPDEPKEKQEEDTEQQAEQVQTEEVQQPEEQQAPEAMPYSEQSESTIQDEELVDGETVEEAAQQVTDPQGSAASATYNLIRRAEAAFESGNKGVSIALLTRASEIADNYGAEDVSSNLLKVALEISKE